MNNEEMNTIEEETNTKLISEKEVMDSIKLEDENFELLPKLEDEDLSPMPNIKPSKKDIPTPDEVKQMSDEEVIELDTKVSELYDEFSNFLKVKAKITNNIVVKEMIPTGIEIFDAILGGGFSSGTLSIIVGPPGCGKCVEYNEEIDIYVEE